MLGLLGSESLGSIVENGECGSVWSEVDGPPPAPGHGQSLRVQWDNAFLPCHKPDTEAKHDKAGNMMGVYHEKERPGLEGSPPLHWAAYCASCPLMIGGL